MKLWGNDKPTRHSGNNAHRMKRGKKVKKGPGHRSCGDGPAPLQPLESRTLFSASHHAPVELDNAQVNAETAILSEFYVFSDSLSDIGELFARTGGADPLPPYFEGRFSDGPVWAEQLAPALGLVSSQATNFAVAGATTGRDNVNDTDVLEHPGLLDQIDEFAIQVGGPGGADPNALYIVWAGPNDFFTLKDEPPVAIANAVTNIATAVGTLSALGAQNIMVLNLPDLGLTPRGIDSGLGPLLTGLTDAFNGALDGALDQLEGFGIDTMRVDVAGRMREVVADPEAEGFSNVTMPSIGLPNTDGFMFFDDIHPTSKTHGEIMEVARDAVFESGLLPTLNFGNGQVAEYTDADGDKVRVRLIGPGEGQVKLLGAQSDAAQIEINGANDRSKLLITVQGRHRQTTVYDIEVNNGSLGHIIAPNTDIIGDVEGDIRRMLVDDFVGSEEQTINITGDADDPRDYFRLIADNPEDVTIDSNVRIRAIDRGRFEPDFHSHRNSWQRPLPRVALSFLGKMKGRSLHFN